MTIEELLDQIDHIDFSASSAYEEAFRIFNASSSYPTYSLPLKKCSTLYRSRTNPEFKQFFSFSELSYPPYQRVNSFSRANRPNQSFLYTSDSPETTYMELLPSWSEMGLIKGDAIWVTTAEYRCVKDFIVTVIPDFTNHKMLPFIEKIDPRELEKEILTGINAIIKRTTRDDLKIYLKSSAFFNTLRVFLRKETPTPSGFLFTSVQNNNQTESGWNVVIDPSTADMNLELVSVFKRIFTVTGLQNGRLTLDSSEPKYALELDYINQEIKWK